MYMSSLLRFCFDVAQEHGDIYCMTMLMQCKLKSNTFNIYAGFIRSVDWLVGCFGFNGPLRQYFSLYRAVSQKREKEQRKDRLE